MSEALDKLWERANAKPPEATVGLTRHLVQDIDDEINQLRQQRDELVEALEAMVREHDNRKRLHSATGGEEWPDSETVVHARQVLAKARGEE